MERIKLEIEYNGTGFSGYQVQPGKRTIQGELERALEEVYQEKIDTFASGRTDKGVHALRAVVHFDPPKTLKNPKLDEVISSHLPPDIRVVKFEIVDENFDARFNAKKKTYMYRFYLSKIDRPLMIDRALRVDDRVDVSLMSEGAKYLVGEHDFRSFVARKSGKTNFVRTIYEVKFEKSGEGEYAFYITGNGFLYNMVRIIMGTLINVGLKKIRPEDIKAIIEAKDRKKAGKTVAPSGLYLYSVDYQ